MCLCLSLGRAVGLEPKNEDEDLQRLAAADEDLLAGVRFCLLMQMYKDIILIVILFVLVVEVVSDAFADYTQRYINEYISLSIPLYV